MLIPAGDDCSLPANARLAWIGDIIVALACAGLRINELVRLKLADHLFDEQAQYFMHSLDPRRTSVSYGGAVNTASESQTKGGNAERATKS